MLQMNLNVCKLIRINIYEQLQLNRDLHQYIKREPMFNQVEMKIHKETNLSKSLVCILLK